MCIAKLDHVYKNYGQNEVLHDINISIESGVILGLVGPNGSGKTTIMKLLSKLIYPTKGIVFYSQTYSALIETPSLYENLSGKENLEYFASLENINNYDIDKIIDCLNMSNFINKQVKKYSLGMKQKLGIALTLLGNPKLIILDEPLNGLDPLSIKEIKDTLKKIKKLRKISILISSHMLKDLNELCDRVIFIKDGKIVENNNLNDNLKKIQICFSNIQDKEKANTLLLHKLIIQEDELSIYINENNDLNQILKLLIDNNIKISEVIKYKNTLEDRYLSTYQEKK